MNPVSHIQPSTALHDNVRTDGNPAQTKEDAVAQDFEKMVLTSLVDEMMKTMKGAAFGSEKNASMWRSFLSEAVADKLTLEGGLGLKQHVSQILQAYDQPKAGTQTDEPTGGRG